MNVVLGILAFLIFYSGASASLGADPPISDATQECLDCHAAISPGIVEAWKRSRHAVLTPGQAMGVKGLARKVSSQDVPEELRNVVVGCAECHDLRPGEHKDTFDHNGYGTHVVVSPKDCAVCHSQEAEQFENNLMSHAHENLVENEVYRLLISSINDTPVLENEKIVSKGASKATEAESCLYCHGTRLDVTGTDVRETDLGEMEFPVISGWPNEGVGRINPDGSRGSCAACHTRHEFSIEMARKPFTCKECHVGPDVPAFKVYSASKHGNIFSTKQNDWNFTNVPWTVGQDFTAPTCAACHISLLVNTVGEVIAERTHEVKNRIPWRIFGLIYAHPHPKEANTTIIRNKDGLPLPTDFGGGFASNYLYNELDRAESRQTMQATCLSCHDRSWVENHWKRFLDTIERTNEATLTATQMIGQVWAKKLATNHIGGGNPFDEYIERVWSDTWLLYANSIRFSSAMGGGGDYGVFAQGRYHLTRSLMELEDWLKLRKSLKK